jgi:putative ABC transport system permease protein
MFKNYLLVALRNLKKHKGYSFINIAGLTVGITCCILILLLVRYEFSFDGFHENADNIYRVISEITNPNETFNSARTPNPTGSALLEEYPEVVNYTMFQGVERWNFLIEGKRFDDINLAFADPSFFEMFTFHFVMGNPKSVFSERNNLVITESLANKAFGSDPPMGKVVNIGGRDFKVAGVIKDVPQTSHIMFDCIFPISNMEYYWEADFKNWTAPMMFYTYVQLLENSDLEDVNEKISGLVKKHAPESGIRVFLQPLSDVHLYSDFQKDLDNYKQGNIIYIYIYSSIAIFILLTACFGFMNLWIARFGGRVLEVGMRKVVGACRKNLVVQFYLESLLSSVIALFSALILVRLFLPVFNELIQRKLTLNLVSSGNIQFILELVVLTLLTGIIVGSYPAFFLSSFQPASILKGIIGKLGRRAFLQKAVVVLQFSMVIFLILGATVVSGQLNYINNKDLGFDSKNVVLAITAHRFALDDQAKKSKFLENPNILSVSLCSPPTDLMQAIENVDWDGRPSDQKFSIHPVHVDYDYLNTFGMKMAKGRFFSREYSTDTSNYILNETAVRMMGLEKPVGKRFSIGDQHGTIIGVLKDYHQSSLHNPIQPVVLKLFYSQEAHSIAVRVSPNNIPGTLEFIKARYNEFVPNRIFSYYFLDDSIDSFYKNEKNASAILSYFTALTIFIACIGLLGLVSYTVEKRSKEIGIRKVSGASVSTIVWLISKDFVKWIIAAAIITFPVARYFTEDWLQNFIYRTDIEWWMFAFTVIVTLVVVFATISYQSIKAALANPVDSLRYE